MSGFVRDFQNSPSSFFSRNSYTHLDRLIFVFQYFACSMSFPTQRILFWISHQDRARTAVLLLLCGESWMGVRVTAAWVCVGLMNIHRPPKHQQRAPRVVILNIFKTPDQLVSDEKSHPIWPRNASNVCKFKRAPVPAGRYEWDL
jgi:hypothetical protein